jgi:hypothetical protein
MGTARWRRGFAGLLSFFVFLQLGGAPASAQSLQLPSTGAPFVVVQLTSGSVKVRAWDRPTVGIDADPSIRYNHAPPRMVATHMRQSIMLWSQSIPTPRGVLSLAAEPFPLPPFAPGDHDAYIVRGSGNVSLMIPEQTPLLVVNVRTGSVAISGFHGSAFVVHVNRGRVRLDDDSGTGAVQVNEGPAFANNSSFDRLRLRTGRGNVVMTSCHARQIAVTSLLGSVLFDDGTFENGIARFESARGAVAIGVNGGAEIEAHAGSGRILYENGVGPVQRSADDAQAMLDGGGPVVTAASETGSVIFYRGTLRDHPNLARALPQRLRAF